MIYPLGSLTILSEDNPPHEELVGTQKYKYPIPVAEIRTLCDKPGYGVIILLLETVFPYTRAVKDLLLLELLI